VKTAHSLSLDKYKYACDVKRRNSKIRMHIDSSVGGARRRHLRSFGSLPQQVNVEHLAWI
jgi:hypothetical protein